MRARIPNLSAIKVYGEFYGGVYPDSKSKNKAIQKTIFYTPELEFEAFDLFYQVTEEDGTTTDKIFNYKEAVELFSKVNLPHAHILAEGNLKELLSTLDPETFESTIY